MEKTRSSISMPEAGRGMSTKRSFAPSRRFRRSKSRGVLVTTAIRRTRSFLSTRPMQLMTSSVA